MSVLGPHFNLAFIVGFLLCHEWLAILVFFKLILPLYVVYALLLHIFLPRT